MGGTFHPRLNIALKPIAYKYREGKVKRTLRRGLKVPEIAEGEVNEVSFFCKSFLLWEPVSILRAVKSACVDSFLRVAMVRSCPLADDADRGALLRRGLRT